MKLIISLIFILIFKQISAQIQPDWVRFYDGQGPSAAQDFGYSLVTDNFGNIIVSGSSQTIQSGNDFITLKYSPEGNLFWHKKYTEKGVSEQNCFVNAIDRKNNIYTGGVSSTTNGWDYVLIKYDPNGNEKWIYKENYPTVNPGDLNKIITDDDLNTYFTASAPGFDTRIVKLDSNGNFLWGKNLESNNYNSAICEWDQSSNSIFVFSSASYTGDTLKLTKFSSNGDLIWSKFAYNGLGPSDLCIMQGNIYLTYATTVSSSNIMKYSSSGDLLWLRSFYGIDGSRSSKIVVSPSGYLYIGGDYHNNPGSNFLILKYSIDGNFIWDKNYGFNNFNSGLMDICIDTDENVYASGISGSGCASVIFDKNGNMLWHSIYKIQENETSWGFANGVSGNNFYVTGYGIGNGTGCDIITLKYGNPIGINSISTEIPTNFSLGQNYPNPFNPTTQFEFSIPKTGFVNITVYDAMGRQVEVLQNGNLKSGTYKADWNASKYPSGIYFYKLVSADFTETKKMVLIK